MILSVSRRTDIPNYYSEWFYNRIKEGFLYVRNPMNLHQVSKINLSLDVIDCIVFWTKNPKNMIERIDEISKFNYYFQFTLTGYGKDVEPNLPDKKANLIDTFQELSEIIGPKRIIWRYDPILLNNKYTFEFHIKVFKEIAEKLRGYTDRVVISFVDFYIKTKRNMEKLQIEEFEENKLILLAIELAKIANSNHMQIETCAEKIDLRRYGIEHGSCIDKKLIENIIGCKLLGFKDKSQREECRCLESIDVGTYNTCLNGCKYCYANFSDKTVQSNASLYDINSPILCGKIGDNDSIKEREVRSLKTEQISMFT